MLKLFLGLCLSEAEVAGLIVDVLDAFGRALKVTSPFPIYYFGDLGYLYLETNLMVVSLAEVCVI